MRKAFLDFLASEGVIATDRVEQIRGLLRGVPEPIGSIAFSYGMITGADIDDILDEQQRDYRPFGEIAISKNLLTRQQVDTLLGVQRIRATTECAEALTLSGVCPIEDIMPKLGEFLLKFQESILTVDC